MKEIDFTKTIYELSKDDDQFIQHMIALGFSGVVNKTSMQTVGRIMTLQKGARIKGIDFQTIRSYFKENGYKIKE